MMSGQRELINYFKAGGHDFNVLMMSIYKQ
jgi:hypothetical protein